MAKRIIARPYRATHSICRYVVRVPAGAFAACPEGVEYFTVTARAAATLARALNEIQSMNEAMYLVSLLSMETEARRGRRKSKAVPRG